MGIANYGIMAGESSNTKHTFLQYSTFVPNDRVKQGSLRGLGGRRGRSGKQICIQTENTVDGAGDDHYDFYSEGHIVGSESIDEGDNEEDEDMASWAGTPSVKGSTESMRMALLSLSLIGIACVSSTHLTLFGERS